MSSNIVLVLTASAFLIFALYTSVASADNALAIKDSDFIIEEFVSGIKGPTTIAFIERDLLVLQKDNGQVRLVRDGILQETPVLDVSVTNAGEQGMLGITTVGSTVYLYFTESEYDGGEPISKRVYRYDWNGKELVNQILVKDLPATRTYHNGGAMVTAADDTVYLVIGDTGRYGKLQNHQFRDYYEDTSVIMRISPEGSYYAMGIRNSFGLAIDPLTGNLWDTENGDDDFDEINFVEPNFNSGWELIMGPATEPELASLPGYEGYVYSDPEFSWEKVVSPTAITFVNSEEMAKFQNSLFVGDCNNGNLYRFELNEKRDGFVFSSQELSDRVVNPGDPTDEIIFGTGFGCMTDLEMGPDGFLYISSFSHGKIYRMIPKELASDNSGSVDEESVLQYVPYPIAAAAIISAAVYIKRSRKKRTTG